MKRALVPAFLLLCSAAGAGSLAEPWKHWRHAAPVQTTASERRQLAGVVVPPAVWAASQASLADLRVIDSQDGEVPYVLQARRGADAIELRPARKMEESLDAERHPQVILDTGEEGDIHNRLELETSAENFFAWVEIAASDDARVWRVLHERAPVYRFRSEGLSGNLAVRYGPSRARYLRARVVESSEPFSISNARVAYERREAPELVPVDATTRLDPAAPSQETWWLFDRKSLAAPVTEVRFAVKQSEFHRAVRVSVSDDGKQWKAVGEGAVYRWATPEPRVDGADTHDRRRLGIRFTEARARFWRVEMLNHDDPPLRRVRVTLLGTPRRVVFWQEPGRSYRLLYGNPRCNAPSYEMAQLTTTEALNAAARASLAAPETNADWVDPSPFTERHPWLLWCALGAALVVVGWMAARALRLEQ